MILYLFCTTLPGHTTTGGKFPYHRGILTPPQIEEFSQFLIRVELMVLLLQIAVYTQRRTCVHRHHYAKHVECQYESHDAHKQPLHDGEDRGKGVVGSAESWASLSLTSILAKNRSLSHALNLRRNTRTRSDGRMARMMFSRAPLSQRGTWLQQPSCVRDTAGNANRVLSPVRTSMRKYSVLVILMPPARVEGHASAPSAAAAFAHLPSDIIVSQSRGAVLTASSGRCHRRPSLDVWVVFTYFRAG